MSLRGLVSRNRVAYSRDRRLALVIHRNWSRRLVTGCKVFLVGTPVHWTCPPTFDFEAVFNLDLAQMTDLEVQAAVARAGGIVCTCGSDGAL